VGLSGDLDEAADRLAKTLLNEVAEVHAVEDDQEPLYTLPPVPRLDSFYQSFRPKNLGLLVTETLRICWLNLGLLLRVSIIAHLPFFLTVFLPISSAFLPLVFFVVIFGFLMGQFANAATTYIVAARYLGYNCTAVMAYQESFGMRRSLLANTVIFSTAMLVAILLSTIGIGIPLVIFILLAWSFYVQAVILEKKGYMEALLRSWNLVKRDLVRLLGVGAVFMSIQALVVLIISFISQLVFPEATAVGGLFQILGVAIVTPFFYVGTAVVYIDLRSRLENLNSDILAKEIGWIRG
jgi:hypothetical protein